MAAYLIANVQITNAAEFEEYRRRVPAVIAAYGGRYLARGGTIEEFETGARQSTPGSGARVSGHGSAQGVLQLTRVPAADCAASAVRALQSFCRRRSLRRWIRLRRLRRLTGHARSRVFPATVNLLVNYSLEQHIHRAPQECSSSYTLNLASTVDKSGVATLCAAARRTRSPII